MSYRSDVDALRTFAVMGVLLYHLDLAAFAGGFLGVDAFFVISGYLMTSIIQRDLAAGKFSLRAFFARRARRILPALFATIALTMIGCALILPPAPLEAAGAQGAAAIFAVSNILFWLQSGYFDAASSSKPLLHTWSLGVEEQFYLVWTMLLMLLASVAVRRRRVVLATVGISSFAAALLFQTEALWTLLPAIPYIEGDSAAFFLMPFRIWEFVIGALLAEQFVTRPRLSSGLKLAGLSLLVGSYLVLDHLGQLPAAVGSVLACAGAALVIGTSNRGVVATMLSQSAIVYLGRISYSVYLVHWPLIVLYKWKTGFDLNITEILALFVMSIALGAVMHHLVEQPLRHGRLEARLFKTIPTKAAAVGGLMVFAAMSSALAHFGIGVVPASIKLPSRGELAARAQAQYRYDARRCELDSYRSGKVDDACVSGDTFRILTVGNSHEIHGYGLLRNLLPHDISGRQINLVYSGTHTRGKIGEDADFQCNFIRLKALPLRSNNRACDDLAAYLNNPTTARSFDALVVASFRPLDWGRIYLDLALRMQRDNPQLKVVVIGSFYGIDVKLRCVDLIERSGDLAACAAISILGYYNPSEEREIREGWPGLNFQYVDQRKAMCSGTDFSTCMTIVDGAPLFYDSHHFHPLGTAIMVDRLRRQGLDKSLSRYLSSGPRS